jgi:polyisoprenoid-binding protein YceI
VLKSIVIAVLVLSLAACGVPRPRPPPPHSVGAAVATLQSLPAPGSYVIDAANSELRILVYRAGPLANLGHNHVMVSREVTGKVQVGGSISDSSFSFSVPVSSFAVDDTQARRAAGSDFPGDIPEDAKSGTRHNMLGAALLNAAAYPELRVKSLALTGTPTEPTAELDISVAGHESKISVPFTLTGDAQQLTASGSMEIRQTALGLTPYSLLGGALQVQDAMQLQFTMVVPITQ